MTSSCPSELIEIGIWLADAAGQVVRDHFRRTEPVEVKPDRTPVTIADRQVERALRDILEKERPGDAIRGEELPDREGSSGLCWVLDPIDGTKAFMAGCPTFGTLIACLHGDRPILGIIDQPILGERWIGAAGFDTLHQGQPCRARAVPGLEEATLAATAPTMFKGANGAAFDRLARATRVTLWGKDCYAYGLLAAGFLDLIAEADMKPHDWAALVPVIEGAGGVITGWDGKPLSLSGDGTVLAAATLPLHQAALAALAG